MNEIYVKNGATLRIEAGTIIYANSIELSNESSIPALIVEKDFTFATLINFDITQPF
jgi:hypothetical protein